MAVLEERRNAAAVDDELGQRSSSTNHANMQISHWKWRCGCKLFLYAIFAQFFAQKRDYFLYKDFKSCLRRSIMNTEMSSALIANM